MSEVLFSDDLKKVEDAVELYPIGSYQIGEVARLSALLHERGIDVERQLIKLCERFGIKTD